MTRNIAISGKGGVGKTTFSSILIRGLIESGHRPIMAVDGDANHCLGAMLGVTEVNTIGNLREELLERKDDIPAGMSKPQYVEMKLMMAMSERKDFDLLTMGRPEGPGCYCYVNSVLRTFMDNLSRDYPFMVIDNEAGLEHLSRRTTQKMDVLFILTDGSRLGIETAARIRDLAISMDLEIGSICLVINRMSDRALLIPVALEFGFEQFDTIPNDPAMTSAALLGTSIFERDANSPAMSAALEIVKKRVLGQ